MKRNGPLWRRPASGDNDANPNLPAEQKRRQPCPAAPVRVPLRLARHVHHLPPLARTCSAARVAEAAPGAGHSVIAALLIGELSSDPIARTSANGNQFATANLRVPAGGSAQFVGLAVFDRTAAEKLMRLRKGDACAATGALTANVWTAKDGTERSGWRITATQILSVYEATKRRKADAGADE